MSRRRPERPAESDSRWPPLAEPGAAPRLAASPSKLRPAFADVPDYAAADVALVAGLGLMSGYSEQKFGPWAGRSGRTWLWL